MNDYVCRILEQYLPRILEGDDVAIPDDAEEMNWRIFFAHSQDMQGFRADIFTGGPHEAKNPFDPAFVGLRDRWGRDSRSLIADLAGLWEDRVTKAELERITGRKLTAAEKAKGVRLGLNLLRDSGVAGAVTFAETLEALRGYKIARKTNKMIRAYVQNAHILMHHELSFRAYLCDAASGQPIPPAHVIEAETRWIVRIMGDFYNIKATIAPYMICDWLLGFWREGRIDWFVSYKPDSVHLGAVEQGLLPDAAGRDFVAFCRTIPIPDGFGLLSGKPCPPRVLNECIWIDRNRSSGLPA